MLILLKHLKKIVILALPLCFVLGCKTTVTTTISKEYVDKVNREIIDYHIPAITNLHKLVFLIYESKELTRNWAYVYKSDDAIDKVKLKKIHSTEYPDLFDKINDLKSSWTFEERSQFNKICKQIELLFEREKHIMETLNSYESYDDVMVVFQVDTEFERGEESITSYTEEIILQINNLLISREETLRKLIGAENPEK